MKILYWFVLVVLLVVYYIFFLIVNILHQLSGNFHAFMVILSNESCLFAFKSLFGFYSCCVGVWCILL